VFVPEPAHDIGREACVNRVVDCGLRHFLGADDIPDDDEDDGKEERNQDVDQGLDLVADLNFVVLPQQQL